VQGQVDGGGQAPVGQVGVAGQGDLQLLHGTEAEGAG
jgi:hypothetical protein